jgi:hypothetical protein
MARRQKVAEAEEAEVEGRDSDVVSRHQLEYGVRRAARHRADAAAQRGSGHSGLLRARRLVLDDDERHGLADAVLGHRLFHQRQLPGEVADGQPQHRYPECGGVQQPAPLLQQRAGRHDVERLDARDRVVHRQPVRRARVHGGHGRGQVDLPLPRQGAGGKLIGALPAAS